MLLEGPPPFKADSEGASLGTNASHTPRVLWCGGGGTRPSLLTTELLAADSARPRPAPNRAHPATPPRSSAMGTEGSPSLLEATRMGASDSMAPASSPFSSLTRARDPRELRKQDACRMVGVKESKTPSYGRADEVACAGPSGLPCYLTTGR